MNGFISGSRLFFLFSFFFNFAIASLVFPIGKTQIIGFERDEITHLPISDVNINNEKYQIETTTDENGYFEIVKVKWSYR